MRRPKLKTVITHGVLGTRDDVRAMVRADQEANSETLQRYHELFYNARYTWPLTNFLGVGTMKAPNDLWMYQEVIQFHRPRTILETGTASGGSALWFAFVMAALAIDGTVVTVDVKDQRAKGIDRHPKIVFLRGSSLDPAVVARAARHVKPPVLVSLDSEHTEDHVYRELQLWSRFVGVGDWLVVEDTNVSFSGPKGVKDDGARGGLTRFFVDHPGEWIQEQICERYLLTMNPGGWLQRARPCAHLKKKGGRA